MEKRSIVKVNICVCGHFAYGFKRFDGQTIKTREVYDVLEKKYGRSHVETIDSCGWRRHPVRMFKFCVSASRKANNIIVLPAHRGIKIFIPLFLWLKKKNNFKLHYVVVGGWLYEELKKNKKLLKKMRKVDYIYVETNRLIKKLNSLGIKNVYHMVNFKKLTKMDLNEEKLSQDGLRCCIFSRIEEKKGVLDAINVINKYNLMNNERIMLDIYGKIKDNFKKRFNDMIDGNKYIRYLGPVKPEKSVDVVGRYDLLLFPTKYKTEGIPGTIIDAFFAGVPVLASKWENYSEIIDDNKTGFGYAFGDVDDFYKKLLIIAKSKKKLKSMKKKCLLESDKYIPNNAAKILFDNLEQQYYVA